MCDKSVKMLVIACRWMNATIMLQAVSPIRSICTKANKHSGKSMDMNLRMNAVHPATAQSKMTRHSRGKQILMLFFHLLVSAMSTVQILDKIRICLVVGNGSIFSWRNQIWWFWNNEKKNHNNCLKWVESIEIRSYTSTFIKVYSETKVLCGTACVFIP